MKTSIDRLSLMGPVNNIIHNLLSEHMQVITPSPTNDFIGKGAWGKKAATVTMQLKPLASSSHGIDSVDAKCVLTEAPLGNGGIYVAVNANAAQNVFSDRHSISPFIHSTLTGQDMFASLEISYQPEVESSTSEGETGSVDRLAVYLGAANMSTLSDLMQNLDKNIDGIFHRHPFRNGSGLVNAAMSQHAMYDSAIHNFLNSLKSSLEQLFTGIKDYRLTLEPVDSMISGLSLGWVMTIEVPSSSATTPNATQQRLAAASNLVVSSISNMDAGVLVGSLKASLTSLLSMQRW